MKTLPLLLILMLSLQVGAQETTVRIITQDSWPPGKNVPVTIEITRGDASGFARFFHDLPQGFIVENVTSSGADFFRDKQQVNYVWLELPDKEPIVIQYLARADESLAGSFKLTGRFDYIADGESRVSVVSESRVINLDRSAEVEPVELLEDLEEVKSEDIGTDPPTDLSRISRSVVISGGQSQVGADSIDDNKTRPESISPKIDFRVQVSISSQRFSQAELEDRLGSKLQHGIKVLKSGNMFKYQSGSFKTYEEGSEYLAELKSNGVRDAFIVAFKDDTQVSINDARSLTEK